MMSTRASSRLLLRPVRRAAISSLPISSVVRCSRVRTSAFLRRGLRNIPEFGRFRDSFSFTQISEHTSCVAERGFDPRPQAVRQTREQIAIRHDRGFHMYQHAPPRGAKPTTARDASCASLTAAVIYRGAS